MACSGHFLGLICLSEFREPHFTVLWYCCLVFVASLYGFGGVSAQPVFAMSVSMKVGVSGVCCADSSLEIRMCFFFLSLDCMFFWLDFFVH